MTYSSLSRARLTDRIDRVGQHPDLLLAAEPVAAVRVVQHQRQSDAVVEQEPGRPVGERLVVVEVPLDRAGAGPVECGVQGGELLPPGGPGASGRE